MAHAGAWYTAWMNMSNSNRSSPILPKKTDLLGGGDDENFLTFESTLNYHIGIYDEYDWENRGELAGISYSSGRA